MAEVSPEFVERYQKLYEKNPKSQLFAPLVEAYRKMGLLQEAVDLGQEGIQNNPQFAGGRIALGRALRDMGKVSAAADQFARATELAPENWLGHHLLGESYLQLSEPKKALKAYKKLLFLNPKDKKAQSLVKKLESLSAEDFSQEAFALKPVTEVVKDWDKESDIRLESAPKNKIKDRGSLDVERFTSLADAYIVRQDLDKADEVLREAEKRIGHHPEIIRRLKIIQHRQMDEPEKIKPQKVADREQMIVDDKLQFLQGMLESLEQRE